MKRNRVLSVLLTFLLATIFVISGCKSGAKPAPYATISAVLPPDGSASRVTEFQNKGNLSLPGDAFLALTSLEVTGKETTTAPCLSGSSRPFRSLTSSP